MIDPDKIAREGARYAKYRMQVESAPMAVMFDGGRVLCLHARSTRALRMMERSPDRVAGVYAPTVERDTIMQDGRQAQLVEDIGQIGGDGE